MLNTPGDHVVSVCWACSGTGVTLKSVGPVKFRKCFMCYGHRGRTEITFKLEKWMEDNVLQ